MVSIGSILKKEREKKKLSLSAVSEETKISVRYLKAIEEDNYTIFPAETYLIGFIRNYARAIGLDPLEIVNLYKSVKVQSHTGENVQESREEEGQKVPQSIEEKSSEVNKSKLKRRKRTSRKMDSVQPVEVIEIKEKELRPKRTRRKKKEEAKKEEQKPLTPIPIKERRFFINPIVIGIVLSGVILLVALILLISHFVSNINKTEKKAIYTELSKIKYLEFNDKVLKYDFANAEYYKIKIGDKFHTIMFEKLSPAIDVNNKTGRENVNNNVIFHFDDIVAQFTGNMKNSIDFDLDGTKDLEININGINQDLISARIEKLHPFIIAKATNTNTSLSTDKTNTKIESKSSNTNKNKKSVKEVKNRKIVFDALVREKTYIKAFLDGKELEGKIYYPKEKIHLEAKEVMQLKIGNAHGIVAKINGKRYKFRKSIANKVIRWERNPYDESVYNLVIKDWQ